MKNKIFIILSVVTGILLITSIVLAVSFYREMVLLREKAESASITSQDDVFQGISENGRLKVIGTNLCNENGSPIQLKGMSTHGIAWYPTYTNAGALSTIKEYGANVVRLSVYSEQNESYTEKPVENMNYLVTAIENALALDMYVIVDWHVLRDEDPTVHIDSAKEFFEKISSLYKNHPGIIYEICNEPNGDTTWDTVYDYANEIIPIIRNNAPDSVVIVGTPNFCIDVEKAAQKPLAFENTMYALHLYFDLSEKDEDNHNAKWFAEKFELGIPVFVSEWGVTNTDGEIYTEQVEYFVDVMKHKHISWCNWSLCNKDEDHSFLKADCTKLSGWTESDLTTSGKIILEALKKE